jgi:hypothetical protein
MREHIPFLDHDRYLDVNIAIAVALIQSGCWSSWMRTFISSRGPELQVRTSPQPHQLQSIRIPGASASRRRDALPGG